RIDTKHQLQKLFEKERKNCQPSCPSITNSSTQSKTSKKKEDSDGTAFQT
ncbi:17098_t:CDS:1, partial [Rhizophagus irregularis]